MELRGYFQDLGTDATANEQISFVTGYTGPFTSNAFSTWLAKQSQQIKDNAAQMAQAQAAHAVPMGTSWIIGYAQAGSIPALEFMRVQLRVNPAIVAMSCSADELATIKALIAATPEYNNAPGIIVANNSGTTTRATSVSFPYTAAQWAAMSYNDREAAKLALTDEQKNLGWSLLSTAQAALVSWVNAGVAAGTLNPANVYTASDMAIATGTDFSTITDPTVITLFNSLPAWAKPALIGMGLLFLLKR